MWICEIILSGRYAMIKGDMVNLLKAKSGPAIFRYVCVIRALSGQRQNVDHFFTTPSVKKTEDDINAIR